MTEPELKKLFDLYNDLWKMTREHHGESSGACGEVRSRDQKHNT